MFEQLTNSDSQRPKPAADNYNHSLYVQVAPEMNRPTTGTTESARTSSTANWLPDVQLEDQRNRAETDPWNQGKLLTTEDAHRVSRTLGKFFYDIEQDKHAHFLSRSLTKREIIDFLDSDKGAGLTDQQRADLVFAAGNHQFIAEGESEIMERNIGKFPAINSLHAEAEITSTDAKRVADTLSKYFSKMDKHGKLLGGGNNYLQSTEITEFLSSEDSRGLTAREVMDLSRAALNADMIAKASDDDWGFESQNGISMKDIEKLPRYVY